MCKEGSKEREWRTSYKREQLRKIIGTLGECLRYNSGGKQVAMLSRDSARIRRGKGTEQVCGLRGMKRMSDHKKFEEKDLKFFRKTKVVLNDFRGWEWLHIWVKGPVLHAEEGDI